MHGFLVRLGSTAREVHHQTGLATLDPVRLPPLLLHHPEDLHLRKMTIHPSLVVAIDAVLVTSLSAEDLHRHQ